MAPLRDISCNSQEVSAANKDHVGEKKTRLPPVLPVEFETEMVVPTTAMPIDEPKYIEQTGDSLWSCHLCNVHGLKTVQRHVQTQLHSYRIGMRCCNHNFAALQYSTAYGWKVCPFSWTTCRLVSQQEYLSGVLIPPANSRDRKLSNTKTDKKGISRPAGVCSVVANPQGSDHCKSFILPAQSHSTRYDSSTAPRELARITEANTSWYCDICNIRGLKSKEYWDHCQTQEHNVKLSFQQEEENRVTKAHVDKGEEVVVNIPAADLVVDKVELDAVEIEREQDEPDACDTLATETIETLSDFIADSNVEKAADAQGENETSASILIPVESENAEIKGVDNEETKGVTIPPAPAKREDTMLPKRTNSCSKSVRSAVLGDEGEGLRFSSVTQNKSNDKWSCSLCGIYDLQNLSVKSHIVGKRHTAAFERVTKKIFEESRSPILRKRRNDKQKFCRKIQDMALLDAKFTTIQFNDADQGSFVCTLCKIETLQIKDVEPHCLGKKHASAYATMTRTVEDHRVTLERRPSIGQVKDMIKGIEGDLLKSPDLKIFERYEIEDLFELPAHSLPSTPTQHAFTDLMDGEDMIDINTSMEDFIGELAAEMDQMTQAALGARAD
jgi:hypothetical protein